MPCGTHRRSAAFGTKYGRKISNLEHTGIFEGRLKWRGHTMTICEEHVVSVKHPADQLAAILCPSFQLPVPVLRRGQLPTATTDEHFRCHKYGWKLQGVHLTRRWLASAPLSTRPVNL